MSIDVVKIASLARAFRPRPADELSMPAEAFRAFHESTGRALWGFLSRASGDSAVADDLSQEAYLRFLRAAIPESADFVYRRNYLFRIATNLLRDRYRAARWEEMDEPEAPSRDIGRELDVRRTLESASPRDRALLWLAYVEKLSHREIAAMLEVGEASVRTMLLRARERFKDTWGEKP